MRTSDIIISSVDRDRLQSLVNSARLDSRVRAETLAALEAELGRATIVTPVELPADVVGMNSTVKFRDLETGESESYTLVYPRDSDVSHGRMSVLAPVGTALLGYRVGDVVQWQVPAGRRRLQITKVVHPARFDPFDLAQTAPALA